MHSVPQNSIETKGRRREEYDYEVKKAPIRYRRKKHKSGLVILIRMMAKSVMVKSRQVGMSTMIADRMGYELN